MAKALSAPNQRKSAWPRVQRLWAKSQTKKSTLSSQGPSAAFEQQQQQHWCQNKALCSGKSGRVLIGQPHTGEPFIIVLSLGSHQHFIVARSTPSTLQQWERTTQRQQTSKPLPASEKTSWLVCKCLRRQQRETGRVSRMTEWKAAKMSVGVVRPKWMEVWKCKRRQQEALAIASTVWPGEHHFLLDQSEEQHTSLQATKVKKGEEHSAKRVKTIAQTKVVRRQTFLKMKVKLDQI